VLLAADVLLPPLGAFGFLATSRELASNAGLREQLDFRLTFERRLLAR